MRSALSGLARTAHPGPIGPQSFSPALTVRLLILQSTPFCNLDCSYCYLPDRDSAARMDLDVVEATVQNVIRSGLLGDRLCVVWHSGEPLVVGTEFYRQAFERIELVVAGRCPIHHSIQTNGTLIDQSWCDLFMKHSVRVGVSVDGPARLHDRHRQTRDRRGTHAEVMGGIGHLRRNAIPYHVICVITADLLGCANDTFRFFLDAGCDEVGFNIDEREGVNLHSTIGREQESGVEAFLARMRELSAGAGGRPRIRELDEARRAILHAPDGVLIEGVALPRNAQVLPLEILSVDHAGNFSTFSPELLGQRGHARGDFVFGNVLVDDLSAVFSNPRFVQIYREILRGVERCRAQCEFFGLCGGGAPVNKLYENGSFDSTETVYCRTGIMAPVRLALAELERAQLA